MSSVLETFILMFESNADDVKKGADEAFKVTDKLENKITETDKASHQLGSSFLDMARNALGAFAAIGAVRGLIGGVFASANYADMINEQSESLGISVEQLDMWGGAVKVAGGTVEGFIGSVRSLSASMAQMDTTGKSRVAPFFKELGISLLDSEGKMRDVMDVLPEIADAFEGLSKQEQIGFGRKLGLDEGTIMLLQRGRREVDALLKRQKELGVVSTEDAQAADEYHDALDDLARVFRVLGSRIAGDVLPAFTWLIGKFEKLGIWLREHEGFIYGFFTGLTAIMGVFAIRAAIAAGAVLLVAWPFYLVAAAVLVAAAAVGLLWDDIQTFVEGGTSLIGTFWEAIKAFATGVGNAFSAMGEIVIGIWNAIRDTIMGAIDAVIGGVNRTKQLLGFDTSDAAMLESGTHAFNAADTNPFTAQTTQSLVNSTFNQPKSNNVTIGEVNVNTQATDADGISNAIGDSLNSQMRQTVSNMDDGVRG